MEHLTAPLIDFEPYHPSEDFIRVAAATPEVHVGDVVANLHEIGTLYEQAAAHETSLVTFPELSITGYSVGDLVQSSNLLEQAKRAICELANGTRDRNCAMIVGLPLRVGNALYNCAAFLADGTIKGIVPKQNLPTYKEFYEKRWYQSWGDRPNTTVSLGGQDVAFGRDQLFSVGEAVVGIEICEDLWVMDSPHQRLAANGATIIANPSASPELVAKEEYRRQLVGVSAGKAAVGYVYAGADWSESTQDIVMSGHAIISEGGRLLAERMPLAHDLSRLTYADLDHSHLVLDRLQNTNYPNNVDITVKPSGIVPSQPDLERQIEPYPFIPHGTAESVAAQLDRILDIQSVGLAQKLRATGINKVVLGLSGGLDSTLALMVALRTSQRLGVPAGELIETLTMPADASSERTQSNAVRLAQAVGVGNEEIPIAELSARQLSALSHDGSEDVTFQNVQARIRTALLFNRANQLNTLVLGTGDLSEIALGWSTFNGDHMSHYNPNASVPKTLVRHLVGRAAETLGSDARAIIDDIIATPISPELTGDGSLDQESESIIGPYELHDFFEYHFVRWLEPARKIGYLALQAFEERYDAAEIDHWLAVFISRFYRNQWKRSVMPDGPKVGTVSHSPRGDWRMPSDAAGAGLKDLRELGIV